MLVYVSGPYSAPTLKRREEHVALAIEAGRQLLDAGIYPLIPHLNHLYSKQMRASGSRDLTHEEYLAWDEDILRRCDGLLKLADSPGADHEEAEAEKAGVPVFYSVDEAISWKKDVEDIYKIYND